MLGRTRYKILMVRGELEENGLAEARIIEGKAIAAQLREQVAASAARLRESHGFTPGLTTILVGDDPASHTYVRAKAAACAASSLNSFERRLPGNTSEPELIAEITRLNADERVDGILVQLPLPPQIDRHRVIAAIDPEKDVDGFHPINVGRLWTGTPVLSRARPMAA